jgi:hypothetical protein
MNHAIKVGASRGVLICIDILLGKDKPLPIPGGENRELPQIHEDGSRERHSERGTQHTSASSRPPHEPSKSRAAPPQETLVNSQETRDEYARKRDRECLQLYCFQNRG